MSRVGNAVIAVPNTVRVTVAKAHVIVASNTEELKCVVPEQVTVTWDSTTSELRVGRHADDSRSRSLHGLVRSLIANNVRGLTAPWEKRLEIIGVGYQASLNKSTLTLNVGFANPVVIEIPTGVKCLVPDTTHIVLTSSDRHLVGQIAADIRAVRPPEPYKGKGIRYSNAHVVRKSGKAFGS